MPIWLWQASSIEITKIEDVTKKAQITLKESTNVRVKGSEGLTLILNTDAAAATATPATND